MDSFKIYLPSNASFERFPNNTPSNYQTHLTEAIQLSGQWEVGVESIFYSNKIGDEEETVQLRIGIEAERKMYITDYYPFKFGTIQDNKWQTFDGYPENIVTDPSNIEKVGRCLTSINRKWILDDHSIFHFYMDSKPDTSLPIFNFLGATSGVVVDISVKLALYFGFGYQHIFCGNLPIYAEMSRVIPKELTKDDYYVKFVDTNTLRMIARVQIKNAGTIFSKTNTPLQDVWHYHVQKPHDVSIEFSKEGKLIVHNTNDLTTVRFSRDFSKSFHIAEAIIGRKTEWALIPFDREKTYVNDTWFVDIYSNEIAYYSETEHYNISYQIRPRIFDDVRNLIPKINRLTEKEIKTVLASMYDAEIHKCRLSFHKRHTQLTVGNGIKLEIIKNLAFMVGFNEESF